jgi:hypothetical protein
VRPAAEEVDALEAETLGYEIFIFVYFVSCILREYLQMMISSTFLEYIQDFWNLVDVCSIIFFLSGLVLRRLLLETANTQGFPDHDFSEETVVIGNKLETIQFGDGLAGITGWKLCYGLSFCLF